MKIVPPLKTVVLKAETDNFEANLDVSIGEGQTFALFELAL